MILPQGTTLVCKATFSFKVNGKGRAITFKENCLCWVTNTQTDQDKRQLFNVARHGQNLACGYDFTAPQVQEFFNIAGS